MKKVHFLLFVFSSCLIVTSNLTAQNEPYKNPALPIEERVSDLVSRMTLDEKISQMINNAVSMPRHFKPD